MLKYVVRRLAIGVVTLFVIITITWVMSQFLPGTPFADDKLSPQARQVLFEKYGLDEPLPVQYVKYMANIVQGDFGTSFYYQGRPVLQIVLERAPVSAFLGFQAVLLGLIVGLPLGIVAALRHNSIIDYSATVLAVLGISVPSFVIGPILQYWVGVKWELLPFAFFNSWAHSILPTIALSVFVIAIVGRYLRAEMLEVLSQDFVTLAKAKGLSGMAVLVRHVLRNSMIPLITVLFPLVVGLVTGTIVIETIFAIPGLGDQFVRAIFVKDYAMILGTTIFFSIFFILAYLVQDILYGIIDPRIRVTGGED
jgi:oligopeptide transport system permease protein